MGIRQRDARTALLSKKHASFRPLMVGGCLKKPTIGMMRSCSLKNIGAGSLISCLPPFMIMRLVKKKMFYPNENTVKGFTLNLIEGRLSVIFNYVQAIPV